MMEHDEAIRSRAAERYVARELTPTEEEAFEQHYFDCPQCAEEVRWEQIFSANSRALFRDQPAAPPKPGFFEGLVAWVRPRQVLAFSLACNAVLGAGLIIFINFRTQPGALMIPAYFAPGPAHGSEFHSLPPGTRYFQVHFPSAGLGNTPYSYEILSSTGKRASLGSVVPVEGEDHMLNLVIPVAGLPAGEYTLSVHANSQVVSVFQFRNPH
jgi:hypothetical protein